MAKKTTTKKTTRNNHKGTKKNSRSAAAANAPKTSGSGDRAPLVVVANRLPVRRVTSGNRSSWVTSPGGLVAALHPVLTETRGCWVGWPGEPDRGVEPFEHEGITLKPVTLSQQDVENYYYGFSNGTLWPLYHDSIRFPQFHRRWWWPYLEVNRRFADAACEATAKNGTVWVQDYQLQLVPGMIRQQRPDLKVGFFLHIPFPSAEMFTRMPWRNRIIEGLLGSDLIGFQSKQSARNFARVAKQLSGATGSESRLEHMGREIKVESHPIAIDFERFESIASSEKVKEKAAALRSYLGEDRNIILGVDRLDYTKGIDVRLRAIEELYRDQLTTAAETVFVQIAVPSREAIDAYEQMRNDIETLVGRINGEYADPGRVAVHYLYRGFPQDELIAYYLAADVLIVTPFQDGMNLVVKEYAASRVDDSGVIVLSEFAGAANELRDAMLVNPFDIDAVTSAIDQAVRLPEEDAKKRMRRMRKHLRKHDVYAWAEKFLDSLRN